MGNFNHFKLNTTKSFNPATRMELHSFNGDLFSFFIPHIILPLIIFLLEHLNIILALWLGSEISAEWREVIKMAEWLVIVFSVEWLVFVYECLINDLVHLYDLIYTVLWLETPFLWWSLHLVYTNLNFFCFVYHWHARFVPQDCCLLFTRNDIFNTAAPLLPLERIKTMEFLHVDGSFFLLRKKPDDTRVQHDVRKKHNYFLYTCFMHQLSFRYNLFLLKLGSLFPRIDGITGDFFHFLAGLVGNVFNIVTLQIFVRYEGAFFQIYAGFTEIFCKVIARFKANWSLNFCSLISTKTNFFVLFSWWGQIPFFYLSLVVVRPIRLNFKFNRHIINFLFKKCSTLGARASVKKIWQYIFLTFAILFLSLAGFRGFLSRKTCYKPRAAKFGKIWWMALYILGSHFYHFKRIPSPPVKTKTFKPFPIWVFIILVLYSATEFSFLMEAMQKPATSPRLPVATASLVVKANTITKSKKELVVLLGGKLITTAPPSLKDIKAELLKAWKCSCFVYIQPATDNILSIQVYKKANKNSGATNFNQLSDHEHRRTLFDRKETGKKGTVGTLSDIKYCIIFSNRSVSLSRGSVQTTCFLSIIWTLFLLAFRTINLLSILSALINCSLGYNILTNLNTLTWHSKTTLIFVNYMNYPNLVLLLCSSSVGSYHWYKDFFQAAKFLGVGASQSSC